MIEKINAKKMIKIGIFLLTVLLLFAETSVFAKLKNMPSSNDYFTGRTKYLDRIRELLPQYGTVYLTGYGGVGKTQVAKEYAYRNEQDYELIWWFDLKGDLKIQYENLLNHINNSKNFGHLLQVDVNNIAPEVLVDFTNTLLSGCDCRWLLIYDNAKNAVNISMPKAKGRGNKKHIIVTTRERPFFGENVLSLKLFTDQESVEFLSKIHPKEKKKDIIRLYQALHNYPLALAQISEEILMYKKGINSYFEKRDTLAADSVLMNTTIVQGYNNNYHEILNFTLQDIEEKDSSLAEFLYMLVLLNLDVKKDLLVALFGENVKEKLMALKKYGVIQTVMSGKSKIVGIHDIIRGEAVKKFNSKEESYRKEVISKLAKRINNFYSEKKFKNLDNAHKDAGVLYAFIHAALNNNVINEEVVSAVIFSLKLNNMLFSKYANYILYQQLACKVYKKDLSKISSAKKALLYANLIFLDLILESKESMLVFEKEMLRLLSLSEKLNNQSDLFFIYTHMSQFYLGLGDLVESKKYSQKAQQLINHAGSLFTLLQYWYTKTWLSYELRDIGGGIKALDNYMETSDRLSASELGKLFSRNFKIKFALLIGQKSDTQKELAELIKDAKAYFNNVSSDIIGELEFTKSLIYFSNGQYKLAQSQCKRALKTLTKVLGGDIIDLTQAHIHILLGRSYEESRNYDLALKEYDNVMKYYNKISSGRNISLREYGQFLANLSSVYYKKGKFDKSKVYYQKLVKSFGLDHEIVGGLVKRLPYEYIYQIGGNSER